LVQFRTNLAESSKEGHGSKMADLPMMKMMMMMMMMMMIYMLWRNCAMEELQSHRNSRH
jgi:hypothetical protein